MGALPDNVLLIRYKELATEAVQRLYLLRLIGKLLHKPTSSYTQTTLELNSASWSLLYGWIELKHATPFWYIEYNKIVVEQQCDKHVLVGTDQLIEDLDIFIDRSITGHSFDEIWSVARYWIEGNTPIKSGKI